MRRDLGILGLQRLRQHVSVQLLQLALIGELIILLGRARPDSHLLHFTLHLLFSFEREPLLWGQLSLSWLLGFLVLALCLRQLGLTRALYDLRYILLEDDCLAALLGVLLDELLSLAPDQVGFQDLAHARPLLRVLLKQHFYEVLELLAVAIALNRIRLFLDYFKNETQ